MVNFVLFELFMVGVFYIEKNFVLFYLNKIVVIICFVKVRKDFEG